MVGINPQTKPAEHCSRCDWRFPGFHICIDKSDPEYQTVVLSPAQKVKNESNRYSGGVSAATRARARESAIARWASHHEANAPRNAEMVRLYKESGLSIRQLSDKFSIAHHTVITVLHKARDEGLLVMRQSNIDKSNI